jgi:hypothetical protein
LKDTPAPADTPATAVSTVVPFAAPAPTATPPPAVTSTGSARVSQDPAVARLERFLAAIQRARRELDSEINAGR